MNKLKLLLAVCLLGCAMHSSAKTSEQIIIIEGHFFEEFPVAASEITGMSPIRTASGATAVMFTLANPLPKAALKYAIAEDQVPEAAELLKRAQQARVLQMSVAKPSNNTISVGQKFPQFTATDMDGRTWSNADVAGKAMVLNLWFTGCGPCRAEMPELSQWKAEMPDVMFFSSTFEDAATARPVLEKQGFSWIPLVGDTQFKEWIDETGYPLTIVVDKSGIISHIEHGTSPLQRETLKQKIQEVQ